MKRNDWTKYVYTFSQLESYVNFISFLASKNYINTIWHCGLVSYIPSQYIGEIFECALFYCCVCCVPFTNSLIYFNFNTIVVAIRGFFIAIRYISNYMFRLSVLSSSDPNAHHHGCFRTLTFLSSSGLNMFSSNSLVSCLDPPLGYFTDEFKALQLIFVVLCGAVDEPLASCILVHFLAIKVETIVDLLICHNGEQLSHCFWLRFTYLLKPDDKVILNIRLPYSHVWNGTSFYIVLQYSNFT